MTLLAGFLDVLLRGVGLLALCAAGGGVAYAVVVLRALGRGADAAVEPLRRVLGLMTLGALVLAGSRAVVLFVLHPWVLADAAGRWPVAEFAATFDSPATPELSALRDTVAALQDEVVALKAALAQLREDFGNAAPRQPPDR